MEGRPSNPGVLGRWRPGMAGILGTDSGDTRDHDPGGRGSDGDRKHSFKRRTLPTLNVQRGGDRGLRLAAPPPPSPLLPGPASRRGSEPRAPPWAHAPPPHTHPKGDSDLTPLPSSPRDVFPSSSPQIFCVSVDGSPLPSTPPSSLLPAFALLPRVLQDQRGHGRPHLGAWPQAAAAHR